MAALKIYTSTSLMEEYTYLNANAICKIEAVSSAVFMFVVLELNCVFLYLINESRYCVHFSHYIHL